VSDRILRHGRVVGSAAKGLSAVRVDSPCDGCSSGGCWRVRATQASEALLVAVNPPISGRIDETVSISVSRSGLTRVALLLFGPVLFAWATLAVASDQGVSGGWLSVLALVLTVCALGFSRAMLQQRVAPLLELDARSAHAARAES
jgi:hypothetical protein